jgi:hypothetical protein
MHEFRVDFSKCSFLYICRLREPLTNASHTGTRPRSCANYEHCNWMQLILGGRVSDYVYLGRIQAKLANPARFLGFRARRTGCTRSDHARIPCGLFECSFSEHVRLREPFPGTSHASSRSPEPPQALHGLRASQFLSRIPTGAQMHASGPCANSV